MRKKQQDELRRLEEALLEPEAFDEPEEAAEEWLDEFYAESARDYAVHNTDSADVDLDSYSADVYEGRRRSGCLIPVMILLTAVLAALVIYLLHLQGVISW